jgi:hypothetical protein
MAQLQNPGQGHPDSGRPAILNGSQGGSVQVGSVTQPTRSSGKAPSSPLNGTSGNQYKGGGPEQPIRHAGRGGAALR